MSKKADLEVDNIISIVKEEAISAISEYDAQYEFHHYCNDLKTIFIYEIPETKVPVEFSMVKGLEARLKKLNKRYTVGIFYQANK